MRKILVLFCLLIFCQQLCLAQDEPKGVRGDSVAIAEAEAMVRAMGGMWIWGQLESLHFVYVWHPWYRIDSYVEDEILDLTGPRSWVQEKSEVHNKIRAYSPEYKYWTLVNGEFKYGSEEDLANALERAPYSIYRLARAISIGDPNLEIRFGPGDIPHSRRLEFYDKDGVLHGWIILNMKREPLVWATTQYRYTFGPLKQFGNLRVPNWGVYENGVTFFEMISVVGDNKAPDLSLFKPTEDIINK